MHSEYKHCTDAATLRPKWGTHLLVAPPLTPFSPVLFDLFSFLRCVRRICCYALLPRCHFWSSMKIYLNTLNAPKTHFTGKEGTLQTWNNESNKNASRSDQTEKFFVIKNSLATSICTSIHTLLNYWDLHTREWSQTGFRNRTMSSLYSNHQTTVTRSQTSGTALGCGETAKSRQKADKSAEMCDAILSIWIKICEDSFQHLGELTQFWR